MSYQGNTTIGVVVNTSDKFLDYAVCTKNSVKIRVFELHGIDPQLTSNSKFKASSVPDEDLPWVPVILPPGSNSSLELGLYHIGDLVYVQVATKNSADLLVVGLYKAASDLYSSTDVQNIYFYNENLVKSKEIIASAITTYSPSYEYNTGSPIVPITSGEMVFPLSMNVQWKVTGWFGYEPGEPGTAYGKSNKVFHKGIDLAAALGTPVLASHSGIVKTANSDSNASTYGKFCKLSMSNETITSVSAHLDKLTVKEGQSVLKGSVIGYVGNSGVSTKPHLHFEILLADGSTRQDPFLYFPNLFDAHINDSPRYDSLNQPRLKIYKP